jgi:protein-S-isoprenylcysteine O-methyltransferase Ste14
LGIGNWLSVAILLLLMLILYALRILGEDKMLLEAFGQTYEAYRRKTWALIPFVW